MLTQWHYQAMPVPLSIHKYAHQSLERMSLRELGAGLAYPGATASTTGRFVRTTKRGFPEGSFVTTTAGPGWPSQKMFPEKLGRKRTVFPPPTENTGASPPGGKQIGLRAQTSLCFCNLQEPRGCPCRARAAFTAIGRPSPTSGLPTGEQAAAADDRLS